jgi:hypothetical protein
MAIHIADQAKHDLVKEAKHDLAETIVDDGVPAPEQASR